MKNVFELIIIAGIIVFTACGPSAKEKEEKAIRDFYARMDTIVIDSIVKVERRKADSIAKIAKIEELAEQNRWNNSTAGKIQKKHPDWTKEDCERLSKRQIWLGMDIQMVVYLRGLPNRKNVSNYGNGNEYQYCWNDYTTSCFYTKEDQIVYSYN